MKTTRSGMFILCAALSLGWVACSDETTAADKGVTRDSAADVGTHDSGEPDVSGADVTLADLTLADLASTDRGTPVKDTAVAGCKKDTDCLGANQFCLFAKSCAPPGTCTTKPYMCPKIYKPVCGCDNKTYGNDCECYRAGQSIQKQGTC